MRLVECLEILTVFEMVDWLESQMELWLADKMVALWGFSSADLKVVE